MISTNSKNNRLIRLTDERISHIFHLPLNSWRLKKLTESYIVSNRKLKNAFGIERLPVTATEGLQTTLESFR
jgi:hypothetical protein